MVINKDMQFFMENLKMNEKNDKFFLTFLSLGFELQIFKIFLPMIWILMRSEEN